MTLVNAPRLNPSHADRYSIYPPRRDGRLSWPWWSFYPMWMYVCCIWINQSFSQSVSQRTVRIGSTVASPHSSHHQAALNRWITASKQESCSHRKLKQTDLTLCRPGTSAPLLTTIRRNARPRKFLCFRLQSGEKVGTRAEIFLFFSFHGMPCNITQQLIKTNWRTEWYPRDLRTRYCTATSAFNAVKCENSTSSSRDSAARLSSEELVEFLHFHSVEGTSCCAVSFLHQSHGHER